MASYLTRQKHRQEELALVDHPSGLLPWEIRFCLEYALSGRATDAIKQVCTIHELALPENQLRCQAIALLRKPLVKKYLAALIAKVEEQGVASIVEVQSFLTDAMRMSVGEIDEMHPLCQKKVTTIRREKDGTEVEKQTLEMVGKLDAIKTLIQMKGWAAPTKVDVNHTGGVMLVPITSGVDDWAQIAKDSQRALMEDAIDI